MFLLTLSLAAAAPFHPVTSPLSDIPSWTNDVVFDDLDQDGDLDVITVQGGTDTTNGVVALQTVHWNGTTGGNLDLQTVVSLPPATWARTALVGDLTGDGGNEILLVTTWQVPSKLYDLNGTTLTDISKGKVPTTTYNFGDADLGDVDGDGDLDALLTDWGLNDPSTNTGGPLHLWLNDGTGTFTDTPSQVPSDLLGWAWSLQLADLDGDFDLDAVVAVRNAATSALFFNDGAGTFTANYAQLPSTGGARRLLPGDLDGDGDLDLVSLNTGTGGTHVVLLNDGTGDFTASPSTIFSPSLPPFQPAGDAQLVDLDHDGDLDVIVVPEEGNLSVWTNAGDATFTVSSDAFLDPEVEGGRAITVGDLDSDDLLDVLVGEALPGGANPHHKGVDLNADAQGPLFLAAELPEAGTEGPYTLRARAHAGQVPVRPVHFGDLYLQWTGTDGTPHTASATWRGADLFELTVDDPTLAGSVSLQWCATDRQSTPNLSCTSPTTIKLPSPEDTADTDADTDPVETDTDPQDTDTVPEDTDTDTDEVTDPVNEEPTGCGCTSTPSPRLPALLLGLVVWGLGRLRRR